jgi:serine/threonine protein kinase
VSPGESKDGLARIGEVNEAMDGDEVQKVGTPYYLAPELWQNKHQTKASDIWALGVVLYEMCAHKYPYDAQNIEELEEKVRSKKYEPIPQGVTKDFNMIIKQCLQKKPENRATIDEIIFSDDFQKKAKINKITLPKHLNKQKLMQSIQTKKSLDDDERKLILGLTQRGFLPRGLVNEPVMVEAALEETLLAAKKQKSTEQ